MMVGLEIGSYTLVSKIGEGGMGAVYVGQHKLLKRKAAVKVLLQELASDEGIVKRFINEAKATSQLHHPGIVKVVDFGQTANATYMVMELLEGQTLFQRLRDRGRLRLDEATRIVRQMAEALAVAHEQKMVHRDLKPENVFLVPDESAPGGERVKILDFGIAKMLDPNAGNAHTRTGSILGTPVYMSPEQCMASPTIDHRADLYALGCVYYQLLVGRPPFDFTGIGELIGAHVYTAPPAPSEKVPGLPAALDAIIVKLMSKKPADRYGTMGELVAALDAAQLSAEGPGSAAPSAELPVQRSAPEAATLVGKSRTGQVPVVRKTPVLTDPFANTMPPDESPARPTPRSGGVLPLHEPPSPRQEITTLGGAVGERTRAGDLPQPERQRSSTLMTMGLAFAVTAVLALGAFFLLGERGPSTPMGHGGPISPTPLPPGPSPAPPLPVDSLDLGPTPAQ